MITSASNNRIKHVTNLITSKKERMSSSSYVVEGIKLFMEAPVNDIEEVYISESFEERLCGGDESRLSKSMIELYKKLNDIGYEIVADNIFKKMSDTVTPQGIMCVVHINPVKLIDIIDAHKDGIFRAMALEGLQDPGNMGTIVRTAEAAGIDLIRAGLNTVDVYSSKVVRSTMGSLFRVPIVYSDDLYRDIELLKNVNVSVYAAHLKGVDSYRDVKYSNRSLILIGNEGNGLTDTATDLADTLVKIPMQGKVESLNAAVAAAILMFEVGRSNS